MPVWLFPMWVSSKSRLEMMGITPHLFYKLEGTEMDIGCRGGYEMLEGKIKCVKCGLWEMQGMYGKCNNPLTHHTYTYYYEGCTKGYKYDKERPNNHSYYKNEECDYFPCHTGISERIFNCKFCYCPLHDMDDCGGNFTILENGIKECSDCLIPHLPTAQEYINRKKYGEEE